MVCRQIISCPLVQYLRGLRRLAYCETGSAPCALLPLLRAGKPVPPTLLPDGVHGPHDAACEVSAAHW
jgi:hypothetical protein